MQVLFSVCSCCRLCIDGEWWQSREYLECVFLYLLYLCWWCYWFKYLLWWSSPPSQNHLGHWKRGTSAANRWKSACTNLQLGLASQVNVSWPCYLILVYAPFHVKVYYNICIIYITNVAAAFACKSMYTRMHTMCVSMMRHNTACNLRSGLSQTNASGQCNLRHALNIIEHNWVMYSIVCFDCYLHRLASLITPNV